MTDPKPPTTTKPVKQRRVTHAQARKAIAAVRNKPTPTPVEQRIATISAGRGWPYILESNSFNRRIESDRQAALHEISQINSEIALLQGEIDTRNARIVDLQKIVSSVDTVLGFDGEAKAETPVTSQSNPDLNLPSFMLKNPSTER